MAEMKVTPLQARALLAAKENLVSAIDIFRPTEPQEAVVRAVESGGAAVFRDGD